MENKGTRWKLLKQHKNMELTQNGRYIGTSEKYDIAINAVQDMRARQSLPMKEPSSSGAKPTAKPGSCAGGPIPGWGRYGAAATPTG